MSDAKCACKSRHVPESLAVAVRGVEKKIGARLNLEAARALVDYCGRFGCNQSEALRRALVTLAATTTDPGDKALADVIDALGLDPGASEHDIVNAIHALFAPDDTGAPPPGSGAGATSGGADPNKAASLARAKASAARHRQINPHMYRPIKRSK